MPLRLLPTFLLAALLAVLCGSARAAAIKDVRLARHEGYVRAVVELDAPTPPYQILNHSAGKGGSLTLELKGVTSSVAFAAIPSDEGPVSNARLEYLAASQQARLHFETSSTVRAEHFTLMNPPRIVVDLFRSPKATIAGVQPVSLPTVQPASPPPASSTQPAAVPVASPGWRRTIVLDPGHGGYHKGGIGKVRGRTVYEKEITIQVAERLEKLLKADPRFEVKLTRRQDVYLGLFERTQVAAQLKGDLFVSLHCNAVEGADAQKRARGFEIWVWNRDSNTSAAAKALAKLENADPGVTRENTSILTQMMIDALESQALTSRRLANAVHQTYMTDPYYRKHDRGIQAARFKVLENYDMPSILIELGFITHPEEARLLTEASFQQSSAQHIYNGIVRYYEQTDSTFPKTGSTKNVAQNR